MGFDVSGFSINIFFLHNSLWTLNYDVSNSVVCLFKYNLFLAYLLFGPTCLTKIFYGRAANNGRSTDNVRSKIDFVRANP